MSKNVKKGTNFTNIVFIFGICLITIMLAVFIFIKVGKPFVIKDYSDIQTVNVENYKTYDKKHSEYYVLVYNHNDKDEEIKNIVIQYANYARTNSDALPIYVLDFKTNNSIVNSSNLNISSSNLERDLPALMIVNNGSVSSSNTKKTISTIKQELVTAMGK